MFRMRFNEWVAGKPIRLVKNTFIGSEGKVITDNIIGKQAGIVDSVRGLILVGTLEGFTEELVIIEGEEYRLTDLIFLGVE